MKKIFLLIFVCAYSSNLLSMQQDIPIIRYIKRTNIMGDSRTLSPVATDAIQLEDGDPQTVTFKDITNECYSTSLPWQEKLKDLRVLGFIPYDSSYLYMALATVKKCNDRIFIIKHDPQNPKNTSIKNATVNTPDGTCEPFNSLVIDSKGGMMHIPVAAGKCQFVGMSSSGAPEFGQTIFFASLPLNQLD